MTFNTAELNIIKFGKESGKSRAEVEQALSNYRNNVVPTPVTVKKTGVSEAVEDIKQTGSNLKKTITDTFTKEEEALQATVDNKQGVVRGFAQAVGIGAGGVSKAIGDVFTGGIKAVLPQKAEDFVKDKAAKIVAPIVNSDPITSLKERYDKLDEKTKRDVDGILGVGSLISDFVGGFGAKKAGTKTLEVAENTLETAYNRAKRFIPEGKVYKSADEFANDAEAVLKQDLPPLKPNATPTEIRARAELEKPILSFKEKLVGLSPDVKKQIAGKPEKMAEYLDVVNARNLDVNNPSAFEFGGEKARQAVTKMETLVRDTGSDIGSFRQKVGTYRATPDQVSLVENTFNNELSKLNLELVNGTVRQKAGAITRVSGKSDISALNDLYKELKKLKQSPDLTNIIDVRNLFTKNIEFGKRVGEVSDSLDGLSKSVRAKLKETGANIVGTSEAQKLADYSDFIEALDDMRSYTDRNAGGEYLLRVLLSGRGGEARQIVNTIKKYTGLDLTDDAVMMTLVTDMLGNQAQKNLFAQELTKAGIDTARILSGDPKAIYEKAIQFAKDRYVDTEQVLREASR